MYFNQPKKTWKIQIANFANSALIIVGDALVYWCNKVSTQFYTFFLNNFICNSIKHFVYWDSFYLYDIGFLWTWFFSEIWNLNQPQFSIMEVATTIFHVTIGKSKPIFKPLDLGLRSCYSKIKIWAKQDVSCNIYLWLPVTSSVCSECVLCTLQRLYIEDCLLNNWFSTMEKGTEITLFIVITDFETGFWSWQNFLHGNPINSMYTAKIIHKGLFAKQSVFNNQIGTEFMLFIVITGF